ncbi:MAG: ATP synthase F0 subunit B, partial [Desulfobacterales bacterium]|nr:ATP synthase F0 subunit B [Desulfobacterales bacterium]
MKVCGVSFKHLLSKTRLALILAVAMTLFLNVGPAFASGGGWADTDWYRTMNFSVLFIALFFLLRKPLSGALNSRIKGIKDQLDELETKKKKTEEELARYKDKLASLDQEAEKIVAQYITQGEAAKARILEEAEKTAEKLEEQAKRNIEQEFKQAEEKLRGEILEKA